MVFVLLAGAVVIIILLLIVNFPELCFLGGCFRILPLSVVESIKFILLFFSWIMLQAVIIWFYTTIVVLLLNTFKKVRPFLKRAISWVDDVIGQI